MSDDGFVFETATNFTSSVLRSARIQDSIIRCFTTSKLLTIVCLLSSSTRAASSSMTLLFNSNSDMPLLPLHENFVLDTI